MVVAAAAAAVVVVVTFAAATDHRCDHLVYTLVNLQTTVVVKKPWAA